MKKALLLFSGLAIFSMAACSKTTINPNEIDPSDLYKMKYTMTSGGDIYGGSSVKNAEKLYLREYDSHNHIASETRYSPSARIIKGGLVNGNVQREIDYGYKEEDTSYTNRYDKNGRLVHRIICSASDMYNSVGFSDKLRSTYSSIENYSYDILGRLVFKETYLLGRYYYREPFSPFIVSTSNMISTNADWRSGNVTYTTEQYIYTSDSEKYTSYIKTITTNQDSRMSIDTTTVTREFNENNDISCETTVREIYTNDNYLYDGSYHPSYNLTIGSASLYSAVTTTTYNTYDQYHCLVKTKSISYRSGSIYQNDNASELMLESEGVATYYKNNPKKPLNYTIISVTQSVRSGGMIIEPQYYDGYYHYIGKDFAPRTYGYEDGNIYYNSKLRMKSIINHSYSYDSQGRLLNDSTTRSAVGYSTLEDFENDTNAIKVEPTRTFNIYTY